MKIAICEDNQRDRANLCLFIEDYCRQHCYEHHLSLFDNGEALLAAFWQDGFDLVFMDVYLPGMSGVDAARKIREVNQDCFLVFITASEDFTMDGFLLQASSYVVKPLTQEQMDRTMHTLRHGFEQSSRTIMIQQGSNSIPISISALLYVEVINKDLLFHMRSGTIRARMSLDETEKRLPGIPFLRCHRSYIVNLNHVSNMGNQDFLMKNGDLVPIRRNGSKEVKLAVAKFIARPPAERRGDST